MYETTADLLEDYCNARLDADLEQAQMERESRERAADPKCWHDGGYLYRPVAFYPEQLGMSPGQMWCYDCKTIVADLNGPECVVCGLDKFNCMGERGVGGTGKYAHEAFVTPPMVAVCHRME